MTVGHLKKENYSLVSPSELLTNTKTVGYLFNALNWGRNKNVCNEREEEERERVVHGEKGGVGEERERDIHVHVHYYTFVHTNIVDLCTAESNTTRIQSAITAVISSV